MTDKSIFSSVRLVSTCKSYSLGLTVGSDTPAFPPQTLPVTILQPRQNGDSVPGNIAFTYNDDTVMGRMGIGPHIDDLGHSVVSHLHRGGRTYDDFAPASGLTELDLVSLGILLDMIEHFGVDLVGESTFCTRGDIIAASVAPENEIKEGDVVLFHSSGPDVLDEEDADPGRHAAAEPEGEPFRADKILQPEHGIYILESMDTRELVDDEIDEFLFVLGQVRGKGVVQMITDPIAIR